MTRVHHLERQACGLRMQHKNMPKYKVLIITSTTATITGSCNGLSWKRSTIGHELMHWSDASITAANKSKTSPARASKSSKSSIKALVTRADELPTSPSCMATPVLGRIDGVCTGELSISQLWYTSGGDVGDVPMLTKLDTMPPEWKEPETGGPNRPGMLPSLSTQNG